MPLLWESGDNPVGFNRPQNLVCGNMQGEECWFGFHHEDRKYKFEAEIHLHHTAGDGSGDPTEKSVYDAIMALSEDENFPKQNTVGILSPVSIFGKERGFCGYMNTTGEGIQNNHLLVLPEVNIERVVLGFTDNDNTVAWNVEFLRSSVGDKIGTLIALQRAIIDYNHKFHWIDRLRWHLTGKYD